MEEFSLADLYVAIKKNIVLIIAITIPIMVASLLYAYFFMPTLWASETSIIFEEAGGDALSMISKLSGPLSGLTGDSRGEFFRVLLASRSVRGRVVDELNLVEEFDAKNRQQAIGKLKDMYETELPVGRVLVLRVMWPGAPRSEVDSAPGSAPEMAAKLAQSMIASLEQEVSRTGYTQAAQRRMMLEEQLQKAVAELTAAENQLVKFATGEGIISPQSQASAAVSELQNLQKREAQLQAELDGAIARHAEASRQLTGQDRMSVNRMSETRDPSINRLNEKIQELQQQIAEQMEVQGKSEKHPDVASLLSELESAQGQLSELMQSDMSVSERSLSVNPSYSKLVDEAIMANQLISEIRASIDVLREQKRQALAQLEQFPAKSSSYERLQREVEMKGEAVERLTESYEIARIGEATSAASFAVIDEPIPPEKPSAPSLKKTLAISMAGSVMLALVVAFVVEGARNRPQNGVAEDVREPDQVS